MGLADNRSSVLRMAPTRSKNLEGAACGICDTTEFDTIEGRIETDRAVVRDGDVRRSHHSVRLPTITELRS
jgi:hypothetical protein